MMISHWLPGLANGFGSTTPWWWGQSSTRLPRLVGPSQFQGWRWWASQLLGWAPQPGNTQPPSRTVRARRWWAVARRRECPMSRGTESPPRTIGTIPAWQASRRAVAASRASPDGSRHTPSTPVAVSPLSSRAEVRSDRCIVITIVACSARIGRNRSSVAAPRLAGPPAHAVLDPGLVPGSIDDPDLPVRLPLGSPWVSPRVVVLARVIRASAMRCDRVATCTPASIRAGSPNVARSSNPVRGRSTTAARTVRNSSPSATGTFP